MGLKTTVIGSYPKPDYLSLPDWFRLNKDRYTARHFNESIENAPEDLEKTIMLATEDVMKQQTEMGIDIITDGEIARENYIWYFCRQLKGFNFTELTPTVYRNGACKTDLPTIDGPVAPMSEKPWLYEKWLAIQALTTTAVKMTIPGPMTIIGTTANKFYVGREQELSEILVQCINREVNALAEAGCKHIQIDEPILVRSPDIAMDYGIKHLAACFEGINKDVEKSIHLCCGYPQYLNQVGYLKADAQIYHDLAPVLDDAGFDAISIEDAHRHNDLTLFDKFKKSTIILGVIKIAEDKIETVDEITTRVQQILKHIPKERLILAPDCGLAMLPMEVLKLKVANMVAAAKLL
ncbi:unnamed protein product [Owenia fusiformis]|uniref:Cobalamin-independent methionine synthase MetE C-terminal/archaeal domain-containing protein n=1 Tax=Owenia fusiformis TaxID=6347 RepID=A0A8S4N436_OWEFU|nr:unnamed protein product [Owenia fusiformis]